MAGAGWYSIVLPVHGLSSLGVYPVPRGDEAHGRLTRGFNVLISFVSGESTRRPEHDPF